MLKESAQLIAIFLEDIPCVSLFSGGALPRADH